MADDQHRDGKVDESLPVFPALPPGRSCINTLHRHLPSEPVGNASNDGNSSPGNPTGRRHHHHFQTASVTESSSPADQPDHHDHHDHADHGHGHQHHDHVPQASSAPPQPTTAPPEMLKRPPIDPIIAVNIAFRITGLDINCETYKYILCRTGHHLCGHPILPIKPRGNDWRQFRDDMAALYGWGSVLTASWVR